MSPAEQLIERYLEEKLTRGIKNAIERNGGSKACVGCSLVIPKYPGRYPQKCPECGDEVEDLQNSPRYSEAVDSYTSRKLQQHKDNKARNAKMRRVPQDRIPLGPLPHYEL